MKRIVALFLALVLSFSSLAFTVFARADDQEPSHEINIVYDDSKSMFEEGDKTWSQATYALRVFAAMMSKKDVMNVYFMSDFKIEGNVKGGKYADPSKAKPLVLNGSDGADVNVKKILSKKTEGLGTYFSTAEAALSDLGKSNKDSKWLVILTDGAFEDRSEAEIKQTLNSKNSDINVMYMTMEDSSNSGVKVTHITENKSNNIFVSECKSDNDILASVIDISQQIFNYVELSMVSNSGDFSLTAPMYELVVFAQGKNAKIGSIKCGDKEFKPDSAPVTVSVTEPNFTDAKQLPKMKMSSNLHGVIATYSGDFDIASGYKVDVSGADSISIYYKLNIQIAVMLSQDGKPIPEFDQLKAGKYDLSVGFVKNGSKEIVTKTSDFISSSELGTPEFKLDINNGGETNQVVLNGSSDTVTLDLKEGKLDIDILARYLDYHYLESQINSIIFKHKTLSYELINDGKIIVKKDGLSNNKLKMKVKVDGKTPTPDQWTLLNQKAPDIKLSSKAKDYKLDFKLSKSDEIGVYILEPVSKRGKLSKDTYDECDFIVSGDIKKDIENWKGSSTLKLNFDDQRSWLDKWLPTIIIGSISLILLILLMAWLNHLCLPKKIIFETIPGGETSIKKINGPIDVYFVEPANATSVAITGIPAVDKSNKNNKWINRKKPSMTFKLTGISAPSLQRFTFANKSYEVREGQIVDASTGAVVTELIISTNKSFKWTERDFLGHNSQRGVTIYINRR